MGYFQSDITVVSTLALNAAYTGSPVLPTSQTNLKLFFYIIFVSVTPAMYIAPSREGYTHIKLMVAIYATSIMMLFSTNYFLFVFFYELIIIPIFFILRLFGHYYRRVQAAFFILIWALLGSFFLFLGIFVLARSGTNPFDYNYPHQSTSSRVGATAIILGFLVKVPLWPFHYWISRAHAEGPTNLSIFLSGVLVKLSVLGILRVSGIPGFKLNFSLFFF